MLRRSLVGALLVVAVLAILVLSGPRVPADTTITFDPAVIGADPEAYLARREAEVANIRPDNQKEIVWVDPNTKARTPLAVVYLHGFSAAKGEIRPVPDRVARDIGANLLFTRLTGHGQDGPAMATATVGAWMNDVAEAMAIGRLIGERVIVIGTSTGGGLATIAAADPRLTDGLAGLVLISPNFRIRAAGSWVLTMPWGGTVANLMTGGERGFAPMNDLQRERWTSRYPTAATLPLAAATKLAREVRVEDLRVPALFILSDADRVVDASVTRSIAARWGAAHELVALPQTGDPANHVIAGDAFSPKTTDQAVKTIVEWIKALPPA